MRIISGKNKGQKIIFPKNLPVRPTTDMAKESIFNILSNKFSFKNKSVIDLFSGSGNISYEFYSRGVKSIYAIDNNFKCIDFINAKKKDLNINIYTIKSDVFKYLKNSINADIIFADPPYSMDKEKLNLIIELIFENKILNNSGVFILEHYKKYDFSYTPTPHKKYDWIAGLYKCFDDSNQCVGDPHSGVMTIALSPLFSGSLYDEFQLSQDFSLSTSCDGYRIDDLSDDTNDMFFDNDKFFIANPTKNMNSFGVYDSDGLLIDEYNTEFPVRSIYSINNIILAGTEDGCYITLLDDGGISDISESKLVLAEGSTIYDIFYDGEQLILSCGSNGIFVYDWNGTESAPSESLRIMDSGNTTFDLEGFNYTAIARFYNGMYFVSMEEDGFQIYNID